MFVLALLVMSLVSVSANAASNCSPKTKTCVLPEKTTAKEVSAVDAESVVLTVSKMTCDGCVSAVTKSLTDLEGVSDAVISLDKGTAHVQYDASKIKPEEMMKATAKAGYPAKVVVSDTPPKVVKAGCAPMAGCDPKACGAPKACGVKATKAAPDAKTSESTQEVPDNPGQ